MRSEIEIPFPQRDLHLVSGFARLQQGNGQGVAVEG